MTSAVGGGWWVPKKQTKGTRLREFCTLQEEKGVKKSENVVDVIYGSPLRARHLHNFLIILNLAKLYEPKV